MTQGSGRSSDDLCARDDLADLRPDVVVDALSGTEPSCELVRQFLAQGVSVVTANKKMIADIGAELSTTAARDGAALLYSAAVGGSAPMLETLRRMSGGDEIRCIAGILSGTCNYVLDRCAEGLMLGEALRIAQTRGFAEADAAEDLYGNDAARKLRILVRHAFGQELHGLAAEPLDIASLLRARAGLQPNETLRYIGRAWKLGSRVLGQLQLEAVKSTDPFAHTTGEWSRLVITRANGEDVVVCGRGAGRWPTTEAVVGDLLDVRSYDSRRQRAFELHSRERGQSHHLLAGRRMCSAREAASSGAAVAKISPKIPQTASFRPLRARPIDRAGARTARDGRS